MAAAPPDDSGFLSRWSRRKVLVRQGVAPAEPVVAPPVAVVVQPDAQPVGPPQAQAAPLAASRARPRRAATAHAGRRGAAHTATATTPASWRPASTARVKNAALKQLFSDPHFNVMDGLDTYIDDYGIPDPCRPACCGRWRNRNSWACSPKTSPTPMPWPLRHPPATTRLAQATPDEDADLRLQPHDAAGRPGAGAGLAQTPGASAEGLDAPTAPCCAGARPASSSVPPRPPPRRPSELLVACTQESRLFPT
jgi:hypothetical protein